MIDCKITENYLKEKARMSKFDEEALACGITRADCPLSENNNDKDLTCDQLEKIYPERAVAIVQKWSDEHSQKTYADDFLEKFPNALIEPKSRVKHPMVCRNHVYGIDISCSAYNCTDCWNEAMEVTE